MAQETKTIALFRLIRLLLSPPARNLESLSQILEVHQRTVRRYLEEDLPNLSFPVKKDADKKYSLPDAQSLPLNLSYGLSLEEMLFLKDALMGIQPNTLKDSLMQKVFQDSELRSISDAFVKITNTETIRRLGTAIRERKQVILKKYHSVESQTVQDRRVEPLQFVHQFTQIRCFEATTGKVKSYSVSRMEQVELLESPATYTGSISPTDAFGLTGDTEYEVVLHLSEKAWLLLRDEFPLCRMYLSREADGYHFRGFVRSYRGIGRFILSLPGEVKVLEDEGLRNFLEEQIKKFSL
jgi:proteasome accessory factor C